MSEFTSYNMSFTHVSREELENNDLSPIDKMMSKMVIFFDEQLTEFMKLDESFKAFHIPGLISVCITNILINMSYQALSSDCPYDKRLQFMDALINDISLQSTKAWKELCAPVKEGVIH